MTVRNGGGRLPQLGAADIALEQLPHRDRRRHTPNVAARGAVFRHQFPACPPGQGGVAAHGERSLDATGAPRVEPDNHAHFPHAGAALAQ
jgi:hypothetical protein